MLYFVQFYHRETLMWDRKTEVTIFKNGFSSVWKKLEHMNVGPIIWVDMDSELSNYFRYPKGIAYVSVYYKSELYKVLTWAKQHGIQHEQDTEKYLSQLEERVSFPDEMYWKSKET